MEILDIDEIQLHRLAQEHRLMSEQEYEALKLSIQDNGQIVPVISYKGKICDGRHRIRALQELGETKVNVIKLPGNLSLKEVRNKVMGTEIRRADNVMQKAIRGYKDTLDGSGLTQEEVAVKVGVSRDQISKAKQVHEKLGIQFLENLYHAGKIVLGKKTLTQLRDILKYYAVKPVDDREYEAPTEKLAEIYNILKTMSEEGSIEELLLASTRASKLAKKMMEWHMDEYQLKG